MATPDTEDFTRSGPNRPLPEDRYPRREDNDGNPGQRTPEVNSAYAEAEGPDQEMSPEERQKRNTDAFFLGKIRTCFRDSTSYIDTSLRRTWDDNLRMFRAEHPSGSKYHHPNYAGRSKLFRPKIRAALKSHEAATAAALFTNPDILTLDAQDQDDANAQAGARLTKALVQIRLEETIPWFLTVLGAWQDTEVQSICITRQEWEYEVAYTYQVAFDETGLPLQDEDGNILGEEIETAVKDRPWVFHVKPENFRFDPNCDWRDVVNSSPFLIEQVPMTAGDALAMMEKRDPKTGASPWRRYELATVLSHGRPGQAGGDDATAQARAGQNQQNPQNTFSGNEFTTVYLHRNILRVNGIDWLFWTVGDSLMLTDPEPLATASPLGRNYAIGFSNLEAHRTYPASTVELGAPLQTGINEITNQRRDNVALALNKRYFIRRRQAGGVDLKSLMRSVPGGGIMVDDPDKDVKVVETGDVTSSSYVEQDRLSVEMDELLGNFSQGSVMNNKSLNETVGGMSMMRSSSSGVQDLAIGLFIHTWVEPVLRQLARLEQMYETDLVVMMTAAQKAGLFKEMQAEQLRLEAMSLDVPLRVKVNVGMGNTNPTYRVEKLSMALTSAAQYPEVQRRINAGEVAKEVFSSLGYGDGDRFLIPEDQLPPAEGEQDPMAAVKMEEIAVKRETLAWEREKFQMQLESDERVRMAELEVKERLGGINAEVSLTNSDKKDTTVRDMAAVREAREARKLLLEHQMDNGDSEAPTP